jgi:predicted NUDIX family NTP pyrophosphohydrolase
VQSWCKDCAKEYYENDKEQILKRRKEYLKNVNNNKRNTISISLNQHKRKGYNVVVTIDECMEMDNNYCYYCGCKLEWETGTGHSNCSPTIDRKKNGNTLTTDNIVFACHACNSGKNSGTIEEYIERCKRVVANEKNILRR